MDVTGPKAPCAKLGMKLERQLVSTENQSYAFRPHLIKKKSLNNILGKLTW